MPDPPPSVTVLIPAHNEESVIVQTVTSVLASDLQRSARHRRQRRLRPTAPATSSTTHFAQDPRVRIIHQVNRGKSAALSRAMAEADTEIVVTIDADTEIEPDAISKLVRHFSDPKVGAMAGNVKVGNRSRWLTRWQALEYITSQNMEKRAFDLAELHHRRSRRARRVAQEAIEAAGGITADTVAEDADLTIAIRRLGWRIGYDEEAIAWTEAPETAGALIRQRFRWTFGTLQSFWKHSDTLFRPKYGTLGWVALPNIFVFQLALPLISPVIDLMFFGSLLLWALGQKVAHLAANLDHRRRRALRALLPGLPADRHPDLRDRLLPRAQGRLDAAVPGAAAALLLPPIDVRGAVPLGEGSRQRPPGGLARRRDRSPDRRTARHRC